MNRLIRCSFECFLVVWFFVCVVRIATADHSQAVVEASSHEVAGQAMGPGADDDASKTLLIAESRLPTISP